MAITNNVGSLKIQITNNNFFPVEGASVYISPTGMPDSTSEEFVTDKNGIVIDEELPAPDVAYSLEPGENQPYSEYNVLVNAPGYNERFISGVQIFSGENGITGTQGGDPGFDPLEYMVRKTHEAGMQFHAWLNPLRIQSKGTPSILAPDHLYTQWREDSDPNNDDWVVDWEEGKYFNPAYPEVREKIIEGIREIVENYPVDAIHFDDYFYPTSDGAFDEKAYQAYTESVGEGVPLTLPQWRIANINTLVSGVYSAIKSINPQVQFGISPQGNITNDLNMGADVETWASQKGYVDYLCPQIYVNFDHPLLPFNQTADQWRQMTTAEGVKLYIGLAVYKAGSEDADSGTWNGKTDILQREIEYSRSLGCDGIMLYSWDYMDTSQTQEEVANVIKIFQEGSGN